MSKVFSIISEVLVIGFVIFAMCFVGYSETHYQKTVTVFSKNGNVITFEDFKGDLWDYETDSISDFEIGSEHYLLMHNNYTENNFYDDIIVKIKK